MPESSRNIPLTPSPLALPESSMQKYSVNPFSTACSHLGKFYGSFPFSSALEIHRSRNSVDLFHIFLIILGSAGKIFSKLFLRYKESALKIPLTLFSMVLSSLEYSVNPFLHGLEYSLEYSVNPVLIIIRPTLTPPSEIPDHHHVQPNKSPNIRFFLLTYAE